jgi:glycosyltransferase involved in cell wall biosynthesis
MNIIISAEMGKGTFEAKLHPLSMVNKISCIYVLRKSLGPKINKVHYIIIPKLFHFSIFKLFIPFMLARKAKKHSCQLILSYHFIPHAFYAYIASKLTGIPFNISQTGWLIHNHFNKKYFNLIAKPILKNALFVNVPGEQSFNKWVKNGVSPSKINILHSVIDTDTFRNNNIKKEYDLIFVGRLNYIKRIDLIIKSISVVKEKHWDIKKVAIVGNGEQEDKLKELSKTLNLDAIIDFVGFQEQTNLFLNKSKVFIMYSYSEGLPVALMEAMSCEKIVVVPNVGNIPSLIKSYKNGYLVNPHNINDLIEKIIVALDEYSKSDQIRIMARKEIIENHSIPSAIKQWNLILDKHFTLEKY